ncbi:hypothetical protein U1Q18_049979 [Sarracenia purpurea var. burkii]
MMKTLIATNSRMWLAISTGRLGTRLMFGCRLSADRPEEFGRKNASPLLMAMMAMGFLGSCPPDFSIGKMLNQQLNLSQRQIYGGSPISVLSTEEF